MLMQNLSPTRTLSERAYSALLEAICDGRLTPGEKLTQTDIAQRLNVSRIPVAQALVTLKHQDFVRESPQRGLFVSPLDPRLFSEIYQFRAAIDPLAAGLAAENVTPEAVARCERIIRSGERARNSNSVPKLVAADMEFHKLIYELSGNHLIIESMTLYWNHLRRGMSEVLVIGSHRDTVWKEHAAIFKSIAAGDAVEAKNRILEHVEAAARMVLPLLAKLGPGTSETDVLNRKAGNDRRTSSPRR